MPPHPLTCANERLYIYIRHEREIILFICHLLLGHVRTRDYIIYIYMRLEREIVLYICVYLLLGHVQHVFHHLDLAAAIN
jgi:hypothetical protein